MASFEVDSSSMANLVDALRDFDAFDEDMQRKLLNAGADHLIETIREEATRSEYQLKSISNKLSKPRKLKKDKDGNYYLTVSVSGKNAKGERNAVIAFVLNYGRSEQYGRIKGSYYWTRAVRRAEKTVLPIYEQIAEEELTERSYR